MSSLTRRDFLKLSGAALLSTAFRPAYLSMPNTAASTTLYHGSRAYPKIAMTYDDCWHASVLEQLTGMLEPYPDFHFTFFAVGDALDSNEIVRPGIWKRLTQSGHEIGYHTYHHVDPQVMSTKSLIADFDQWMTSLTQKLGFTPRVHFARPPYDDLSRSFEELCQERGLIATLFSTGFEAQTMQDSLRLAAKAQNGDVVQMHTYQDPANGRHDVEITRNVLPLLAENGFSLVTMSQLFDDVLREEHSSAGCTLGAGASLTRTCLE